MQTDTGQKEQHTSIPLLHLHTHPAHVHTHTNSDAPFYSSFTSFCFLWSTHPLCSPFPLFHSSPPCLTRSSLLSSPLFLFLFPLHSLMLGLSQQTDPRSETGGAVPCRLSITDCWPMGAENLLTVMFCSELQEAGGGG